MKISEEDGWCFEGMLTYGIGSWYYSYPQHAFGGDGKWHHRFSGTDFFWFDAVIFAVVYHINSDYLVAAIIKSY